MEVSYKFLPIHNILYYIHTVAMFLANYAIVRVEGLTIKYTPTLNNQSLDATTYHKQQKLSRRKLSQFLRIFDELQKFSLLIDRHRAVDIIMEAKS